MQTGEPVCFLLRAKTLLFMKDKKTILLLLSGIYDIISWIVSFLNDMRKDSEKRKQSYEDYGYLQEQKNGSFF